MKKVINIFKNIFDILAQSISPILPMMIGVGMLKLLLLVLSETALNILPSSSDTHIVLNFVSDAAYYFLPIFVAISASEVFNTNKYIAGLLGAILLSPVYVELVKTGQSISIFKLPITLTNYESQLISPILIVWLLSLIYNFLDSKVSDRFKTIVVPMVSIIIMVPIVYSFIGPIGVKLSGLLTSLVFGLYGMGALGSALYAALLPIICIIGLGPVSLSITIQILAQGPDPITFFNAVCYNVILGVVVLTYYLKHKDNEALAAGITSAIAGVSEPALFGVVVKHMYLLIPLCTACFVSGLLNSIFKIRSFVMASMGIIGMISTMGGETSIVYSIISLLIGIVLAYIISSIVLKKVHE